MSRCGVYVENGPPVPVLSGAGLYVEDSDHNEIFLMSKAEITLVTRDTSDFEEVLLNATYLYEGVEQTFSGGSKFGSHCIAGEKFKKFLFILALTLIGDASVVEYTQVCSLQKSDS